MYMLPEGSLFEDGQIKCMYREMQSDEKSFFGDVVLDSFDMSYRDEDSIIDQKYEKQIFCALIMKILNFRRDRRKCIYKEIQHITTRNS